MRKKIHITRHLLFCTGNKCIGGGGEELKILAQNIRDQTPCLSTMHVSKMGCLKQCESGPMAVLYPDGYWFSDLDTTLTKKLLDQIQNGQEPLPENRIFELKGSDSIL